MTDLVERVAGAAVSDGYDAVTDLRVATTTVASSAAEIVVYANGYRLARGGDGR